MKRSLLIWGLLLTVGGWLLFRFGIMTFYPEAVSSARAGNLGQFWAGLTIAQKFFITGMEIPVFTGIVLVVVALVRLVTGKKSPK
jgi:hypothetical protein